MATPVAGPLLIMVPHSPFSHFPFPLPTFSSPALPVFFRPYQPPTNPTSPSSLLDFYTTFRILPTETYTLFLRSPSLPRFFSVTQFSLPAFSVSQFFLTPARSHPFSSSLISLLLLLTLSPSHPRVPPFAHPSRPSAAARRSTCPRRPPGTWSQTPG